VQEFDFGTPHNVTRDIAGKIKGTNNLEYSPPHGPSQPTRALTYGPPQPTRTLTSNFQKNLH